MKFTASVHRVHVWLRSALLTACVCMLVWVLPAEAQPEETVVERLTIVEHPTPEELEQGFARWAEEYPNLFAFEVRGTTLEDRPILMGRITDKQVPDSDKQIALFTSAHGPAELSATTGLLRLMKWLLSDDPEAAEIRERQIVLVVPYTDPDHMALGKQTRQVYGGWADKGVRLWTVDGVSLPEKHPEAVALQGIMDEYRPELYIDFHGFKHAERTMWDSTGISWGSPVSRSFLHDVPRVINEAAEEQGFLITRGEQDAGKIRTTSSVEGFPDYLFYGRRNAPIITLYPYARYHTLAFIMETGSEESTIARAKRALQVGHERGRYERYVGYPVNQVGNWTLVAVSAYGTNATERRNSRSELWQKLPEMSYGTAGTPARQVLMGYVATTPEGRSQVRSKKVSTIIEEQQGNPRFDFEGLAAPTALYPFGAFGGARTVYKPWEGALDQGPIEHGLVIRLLIPYNDAQVSDVRLDGHLIEASEMNGYHIRRNPGTVLEIAIPPDKVEDFHIVSCRYDTPTVRRAGFTSDDW